MKSNVYAIRSGLQHIKFGVARDVKRRLCTLRSCSPAALDLVSFLSVPSKEEAHYIEKHLHHALAHLHVSGEWFVLCEETIEVARLLHTKTFADFLPAIVDWKAQKAELNRMFGVRGNMESLELTT